MQNDTTQNKQGAEAPLSRSLETAAAVVAEHCFKDKAFGEKFSADPKAALAEQNLKIDQRQVHVHKNDARNWHIVLPHLKAREVLGKYTAAELESMSEADMQKLSGGEIAIAAGLAAIATTATVGGTLAVAGAAGGAYAASKKK